MATSLYPKLSVWVKESLKDITVQSYSRERIILRYPLIFNWKITLDAKDFPMLKDGFPTTADGNIPAEIPVIIRIFGIKITIFIRFTEWKQWLKEVSKVAETIYKKG